jgi:hypothetical protein
MTFICTFRVFQWDNSRDVAVVLLVDAPVRYA